MYVFKRNGVNFICEQYGEVESDFKKSICSYLISANFKVRAYLVRVSYSKKMDEFNVALCFGSESNQQQLLDNSTKIFKNLFGHHEHLDVIFLDENHENTLRRLCCPFYTSTGYQIEKPDFYLTSSEGYDLETVKTCFKRKKLLGVNQDGYMLFDITPPLVGQKYGLGGSDISMVILASRHKEHSIFNIKEWPAYVHVARTLTENIDLRFSVKDTDMELIGWGEIYPNQHEIRG